MRKALLLILGLLPASGVATTPLAAQSRVGLSLDLTGGMSRGTHAANYRNRGGAALDALVALRRGLSSSQTFLVSLALGVQGMEGSDLACVPEPATRSCLDNYPRFRYVALTAGIEWGYPRRATARLLVGPAFYERERPVDRTVGLQSRLELGTPPWGRMALVGSARAALVPTLARRTVTLGVLALGVRVQ